MENFKIKFMENLKKCEIDIEKRTNLKIYIFINKYTLSIINNKIF